MLKPRDIVLLTILSSAQTAWATKVMADELCDRLRSLEWSAPARPTEPSRRWIEMHWRGHWLDFDRGFGLSCRSSGEPEANALCNWLPEHTSFEFSSVLPMRILECHGYKFPRPFPSWGEWKSEMTVGERGLLEINFADLKGETGAIRFSTFAPNHDDATDELPPLTAMPPLPAPSRK